MDIHPSILSRIYAVGLAAAERDRSSAALAGVRVLFTPQTEQGPATFTIAATDSKILVEEVHTVVDGETEPWEVIVRDWDLLYAWVKPYGGKKPKDVAWFFTYIEATNALTGAKSNGPIKSIQLEGADGRELSLRIVEGCLYPAYAKALEPSAPRKVDHRICFDPEYAGRFKALWKGFIVLNLAGRGILVNPLNRPPTGGDCRGLIMPVTLPSYTLLA
jgi:hypothetical protein